MNFNVVLEGCVVLADEILMMTVQIRHFSKESFTIV